MDYKAVLDAVTAYDAAVRYGLWMNKGKAHCIHGNSDTTPSMHFFENGSCYCFSCNRQVDAINIAQYFFGGTATDAANRLCRDFGLPYGDMGYGIQTQYKRTKQDWEIKSELKDKLKELYRQKAVLEGEFEASNDEVPTEEWLDRMNQLLAKIGDIELDLNNMYAAGVMV